jgi:hypothetical protein
LNPLPYPSNCTLLAWVPGNFNASSTYGSAGPQYAADGNTCTAWNSGTFAPDVNDNFVWWQSSLACYRGLNSPFVCPAVTHVGIVPEVSQTEDVTFFLTYGNELLFGNETHAMSDGVFSMYALENPLAQTVSTTSSLGPFVYGVTASPSSWVAVREIALFNCQ